MQTGIIILLGLVTIVIAMFVRRSMDQQVQHGFKVYVIKKGHTLSTRKIEVGDDKIAFTTIFSDSSWYRTENYIGNILYGISFGFDNSYNSLTIYWRPVLDKLGNKAIELYYCASIRGQKKYQYLQSVELNEEVFIKIQRGDVDSETHLTLIYQGNDWQHHNLPRCEQSIPRFIIFPRFRQGKGSPHDMKIFIANNKF